MANGVSSAKSRLFFVTDKSTKVCYLVGTGVQISVCPSTLEDRRNRQPPTSLAAAYGSIIYTYGEKSILLYLGLRRTFRWNFIIADTKFTILGADFSFLTLL